MKIERSEAPPNLMKRLRTAEVGNTNVEAVVGRALARHHAHEDTEAFRSRFAARVCGTIEKYCLSQSPRAGDDEIVRFIERLRLDELRLVVRCEIGDEAAWRELVERFTPTVRAAACVACTGDAEAQELASSVWGELHGFRAGESDGEPSGGKGKLAYYSGCGSLGGWLRAVVAQLAVDRHRQSRRFVQCEDAEEFERLGDRRAYEPVSAGEARTADFRPVQFPTPEQALAERETGELLNTVLLRAVADLAAEDRLLLKLYYLDGLRLREAGAALGFHEATASRRLAALHKRLRERSTVLLETEHNLTTAQVAALFANATHATQVDMRSLLGADDAPG